MQLACGGCAHIAKGVSHHAHVHDDISTTYRLFVPDAARAGRPMPLLVALHRFTEDAGTLAAMTSFESIAQREGFIVLAPNGPGRRFRFSDVQQESDVDLILSMVDDVAARHRVDHNRIYLTGASNGGFMCFALLREAPERFAAAAPVMAVMPRGLSADPHALPPVPIVIIYGTADRIIPPDRNRLAGFDVLNMEQTIDYWQQRNRCTDEPEHTTLPDLDPTDNTRTVRSTYASLDRASDLIVYRVIGGGHTWPGGREPSPRIMVGNQSHDFNASEVIWQFFARHPIDHPRSQ